MKGDLGFSQDIELRMRAFQTYIDHGVTKIILAHGPDRGFGIQ